MYRALKKQIYISEKHKLTPIRFSDRFSIMKWRNEQIYHLRQEKILTNLDQNQYFNNVISQQFILEKPKQILFSYLENNICVGYGGLVHINWTDKNAEISFIMKTELEKNYFHKHWTKYLSLIEQVAFKDLKLHKIYVYAFDLRPHLYNVLKDGAYYKEAVLKEHCFFNNKYINVVIHSKINNL